MSPDAVKDLADLINDQVDHLWVLPLAVLGEIYISGRFFSRDDRLLFSSIAMLLVSLFAGLLAKGSTISMFKSSTQSNFDVDQYYSTAAIFVITQMAALWAGILIFAVLAFRNKEVLKR